MEDLYVESFFKPHSTPATPLAPSQELSSQSKPLQTGQQARTFLLLLEQEIDAQFKDSYPIQRLFQQMKGEFALSHHNQVIALLDQLEELVDVL